MISCPKGYECVERMGGKSEGKGTICGETTDARGRMRPPTYAADTAIVKTNKKPMKKTVFLFVMFVLVLSYDKCRS
jgi:hypothetical protein